MDHVRGIRKQFYAAFFAVSAAACRPSEQQVADMAAQAQQMLEAGQPAQARDLISHAVLARDDLPQVFLVQARVALALGRRAEAYQAYTNALALQATNNEALLGVAQIGISTGHIDDAADAADRILALNPNQTDALLIKGIVQMVHNDLDGAVAFADKVLTLKPGDIAATILKSRVLALQGDRAAALTLVDKAIARSGPTLELTMALAELQRQGGDPAAFLASMRRIKELAPDNRDYRFDLVDTLYRLGRRDEARGETIALIEAANRDPHEADRYARLWYAYDRDALTAEQLERVSAKASVETRLALAHFYVATGRGPVATALLRPVATGWSSDIQGAYARALGASGNPAAAHDAAVKVLARDPNNGDALLVKADAALTANDPATAIIGYQRVVRDYPEWEEGYLGLARAYAAADKPDGVHRAFENGGLAMPQSLPLARAYVIALLRAGDRERAQEVAHRFALNSPSLPAGWMLYADVCARSGGSDCQAEAADGLRRTRTRFGLDPAPGTPPPVALIGRLG